MFILAIGAGTGFAHFHQATGAVVAHAGHDYTEGIAPGLHRRGAKQHIHRRPMATDQRPVLDLDVILPAAALDQHVPATWCNQRQARQQAVAVLGLAYFDGTDRVEPLGEAAGKFLRHMLDDGNRRRVDGQLREYAFQGLGAASGSSQDDDFLGGALVHQPATGRAEQHIGVEFGRRFMQRRRRLLLDPGLGRGADGIGHLLSTLLEKITQPRGGFADHLHGTRRQGLQGNVGALLGQGRADHHRRRPGRHDLPQEADAIHARHFHVQQDHVRPYTLHFLQGQDRVHRRADHLDILVRLEQLLHGFTHYRRVIDDHHLDRHQLASWNGERSSVAPRRTQTSPVCRSKRTRRCPLPPTSPGLACSPASRRQQLARAILR